MSVSRSTPSTLERAHIRHLTRSECTNLIERIEAALQEQIDDPINRKINPAAVVVYRNALGVVRAAARNDR